MSFPVFAITLLGGMLALANADDLAPSARVLAAVARAPVPACGGHDCGIPKPPTPDCGGRGRESPSIYVTPTPDCPTPPAIEMPKPEGYNKLPPFEIPPDMPMPEGYHKPPPFEIPPFEIPPFEIPPFEAPKPEGYNKPPPFEIPPFEMPKPEGYNKPPPFEIPPFEIPHEMPKPEDYNKPPPFEIPPFEIPPFEAPKPEGYNKPPPFEIPPEVPKPEDYNKPRPIEMPKPEDYNKSPPFEIPPFEIPRPVGYPVDEKHPGAEYGNKGDHPGHKKGDKEEGEKKQYGGMKSQPEKKEAYGEKKEDHKDKGEKQYSEEKEGNGEKGKRKPEQCSKAAALIRPQLAHAPAFPPELQGMAGELGVTSHNCLSIHFPKDVPEAKKQEFAMAWFRWLKPIIARVEDLYGACGKDTRHAMGPLAKQECYRELLEEMEKGDEEARGASVDVSPTGASLEWQPSGSQETGQAERLRDDTILSLVDGAGMNRVPVVAAGAVGLLTLLWVALLA